MPGKVRIPIDKPSPIIRLVRQEAAIKARYDQLGGAAVLGVPVITVFGQMWRMPSSALVYEPDSGAVFEIHGMIFERWIEQGALAFGVPTTDESPCLDGVGRSNHFAGGRSIFWHPSSGAHAVWGDIRARWADLGWERSYLGYPTSSEVDFADNGRANDFQNGGIYWWADTGAIDLSDVIVHYTGLHCFGETDWDQGSSEDEPYCILAMSTPTGAWSTTTRTYDDVDAGEARPDLIELYRGRPYGLNIGIVLMESDFGDPNKYREDVQKVVDKVHAAGTVALGAIPVVGPAIAAVAGPLLGKLMPALGGAINDLFDWGDDRVGSANVTLTARELVLLATRTSNSTFKGIGFKRESDLISGDGASYKAYFGVVPV